MGMWRQGVWAGVLFSSLVSVQSFALTREIKSFNEALPYIDQDTLLVFDVDNTLITPTTAIGSDQWFYCLYDVYGKKPLENRGLDKKLMDFWNQVQSKIQVRPVEKLGPEFVRQQQAQGIKMMALTARTSDILSVTIQQLASIGVHLEKNTIFSGVMKLSKKLLGTADTAFFNHGVLSVGESNSKGSVFTQFLKKLKFTPKKVVYIDDREKHVKTMEAELGKMKIPYFGFRYGALDQEVKDFKCEPSVPIKLVL